MDIRNSFLVYKLSRPCFSFPTFTDVVLAHSVMLLTWICNCGMCRNMPRTGNDASDNGAPNKANIGSEVQA